MTINFTRTCTTLGLLCGALNEVNTARGTTWVTRRGTLITQFGTAAPYGSLVSGWYDTIAAAQDALDGYVGELGTLADATILNEVVADRPLSSADRANALSELVRQMTIASESLAECPGTVTVADVGSPTGDHKFVATRYEGLTGRISDFLVPDVWLVACTADRSQGGTAYAETFSVIGKPATDLPTDATYPSGTSLSTSVTAVDPSTDGGLVTDPGFANWTVANTPDAPWAIYAGVAGTSVFRVSSNPRSTGTYSLRLFGAGGIVLKVRQQITATAKTAYAVHFRVYDAADPGTDWAVTVSLTDAAGTAVTGPASYSNVVSSAAAGSLSGDWLNAVTGQFVTPAVLPASGLFLEIRLHQSGALTTAPAANSDVYVNHVCMVEAEPMYAGGPGLTCFSGTAEGVVGDTRTVTTALTSGVPSTYLIRGIDRLLNGGLAEADVRIPTSGAPTQADALVT